MGYSDYSQAFQGAGQQYGVDPNLLSSVAWQESRYNPRAVGKAGEQGMMQFMPATAKGIGLSNPMDPNASIYAAANLLHQNLQATGGDPSKALQMYNGGTNPNHWNPAYASSVLSHAQQMAAQGGNPYQSQPPQPQGQPPMQQPPMSLGQMAQQPMPQPNMDSAPMQPPPPQSLGQMAASLPQGNIPQKSHSKFTAGNIMGVLGDALSAYGGRQPTFGPFLREQQMMDKQEGFEREKYQQEMAMRMYAMTHPEEMMKAQAFQAAPQNVRQSMVDYENTMHPDVVGVQQPNGSVINQVQPRKLAYQPGDVHPGTDGSYMFIGGDPTSQASWKKVQ